MALLSARDAATPTTLILVGGSLLGALVVNLALLPGIDLVSALYLIPVLIAAHRWPPRAVAGVGALGIAAYASNAFFDRRPLAVWLSAVVALSLTSYLAVGLANQRNMAARRARELEDVTARFRAVQVVSDAVLAHLGLNDLLPELLNRIRQVMGVDTAAFLMLEGDELVARAAAGLEEEVERGVRIPVGRGFAGRVAAERGPVIIEDVDHADTLNPLLREKGVRSLLGVPLFVEGRVLGVLHVGTLQPRSFSPEDVNLLQLVADRAALAIDHARLYEAERVARRGRGGPAPG